MTHCKYCHNTVLWLSEFVWFCTNCGRGESVAEFNSNVYDSNYMESYIKRGATDVGKRLTASRVGLTSYFLPTDLELADFGCGAGNFIVEASKFWKVTGIEATEAGALAVHFHTNQTVVSYDKFISGDKQYDAITFFDSLEHVPNLNQFFSKIMDCLKLNGIVVVTMPELPNQMAPQDFKDWRHNKPYEHLSYFTQDGFKRFLNQYEVKILLIENNESFLRFDPNNSQRNIMTFVAQKITSNPR